MCCSRCSTNLCWLLAWLIYYVLHCHWVGFIGNCNFFVENLFSNNCRKQWAVCAKVSRTSCTRARTHSRRSSSTSAKIRSITRSGPRRSSRHGVRHESPTRTSRITDRPRGACTVLPHCNVEVTRLRLLCGTAADVNDPAIMSLFTIHCWGWFTICPLCRQHASMQSHSFNTCCLLSTGCSRKNNRHVAQKFSSHSATSLLPSYFYPPGNNLTDNIVSIVTKLAN